MKSMKNTSRWQIPFWLGFLALLLVVFDLGFEQSLRWQAALRSAYSVTIALGAFVLVARYFYPKQRPKRKALVFDAFFLITYIFTLLATTGLGDWPSLSSRPWLAIVISLIFFRELSALKLDLSRRQVNPAQLFAGSFMALILIGTLLLMLPNATYNGLGAIDALFTSTSAVCVTGLVVVDTGSYFTLFGQVIILLLIQLGGIGVMTFTSYFGYFFRGASSLEHQLLLSEMTNSDRLGEVFGTLKKIILLTFFIEATGALIIYATLDDGQLRSFADRLFFSGFHAVSAFCNAGFSTLTNSLYEPGFRFNYPLHLVLAGLFVFGGIGFPIVFNFIRYLRYRIGYVLFKVERVHLPWIININTRIVLATTGILLAVGTGAFYVLEYHNTLAEHNGFGKIVTAFFGAATPRTAGFNSVDTAALTFPATMIIFFLMWVGASPGSTGGGIKTSTLAIGTLNFFSLAQGKKRIEAFHREISGLSVRRAFAIISLSLIVIGFAIFALAISDSDKDLLHIAFEAFSAYSTVGLSLGITASLSTAGKVVIIVTMFIGRVSMLTLLVALVRKVKYQSYSYPTEDILIN